MWGLLLVCALSNTHCLALPSSILLYGTRDACEADRLAVLSGAHKYGEEAVCVPAFRGTA